MIITSTFGAANRFLGTAGDIANTAIEINRYRRVMWRRLAQAAARAVRDGVNAWLLRKAIGELKSLDDRMLADLGLSRSLIESAARQKMTLDPS